MNTTFKNRVQQLKDPRLFLAYGGGSGFTPKMPGTAGTLLAFPLYYGLAAIAPLPALIAIAAALFLIGIPLCTHANRINQTHDDSAIVWDEIVGFYIVLIYVGYASSSDDSSSQWTWQFIAFVLFRFFDAVKPFPISWLDKKIPGGIGIMTDDLAAATATLATLFLLSHTLPL